MRKFLLLFALSLSIMIIAGCADCDRESDYDLVGVTLNDFTTRANIKSTSSTSCKSITAATDCIANPNNTNQYGVNRGFVVQCGTKKFNLQQTINTLFPMEAYKEERHEECYDYYVYDFIAASHRSATPYAIQSIIVSNTDKNLWYITIDGTCYEWNVTGTAYAMQ